MKKAISLLAVFTVILLQSYPQTVTDIDGNTYHTVTIGTQVWMLENLKTTKYNDGTAITFEPGVLAWNSLTTGAYCWYGNDPGLYKDLYGALYNWYAASSGKLAPQGWHVPSKDDWNTLIAYLGGESLAGGKLKEAGNSHWIGPNTGADNSSGFTALPGGLNSEGYDKLGDVAWCWTSTIGTAFPELAAWACLLDSYNAAADMREPGKASGMSVRCVRDYAAGTQENDPSGWRIYPNPATDYLAVDLMKEGGDVKLSVYNLWGKLLIRTEFTGTSGLMDLSGLIKGIYIVKMENRAGIFQRSFVKE